MIKKIDKTIAIIGGGYVGTALLKFFIKHYNVYVKDIETITCYRKGSGEKMPFYSKADHWNMVNSCELACIAVPTPYDKEDGHCDTSIVEKVVSKLETPLILIKSTVSPGTTDYLKNKYKKRICFSGEFVGQSSYYTPSPYDFDKDMVKTPFFIVGGDKKDTREILNIVQPIMGPVKNYFQCTAKEAEMMKVAENSIYASKVSIFNQIYDVCEALDIDYNVVREGLMLDPRQGPMHTMVFQKNRGWNSFCYNKDLPGLIRVSINNGFTPRLLLEVLKSNADINSNEEVKNLPKLFKDIKERKSID